MHNTEILQLLNAEQIRQIESHNFIASENYASSAVKYFCGSEFSNKYAEGYPGKRYYNGCKNFDALEELSIELVTKLYDCNFANVQPHSGANANLAIFKAFLKPGDTILSMDLSAGGHLSHGSKANLSGQWFDAHFYGVGVDGYLDYAEIQRKAYEVQPKLIIAGGSAYPRKIDFAKFRKIADSVDALFLVDMAHYSGLIAGGVYTNPLPHADFVTSTTHKTLRGARGGMILWNNDEFTKKINAGIFPGTQGGPLMNQIAGKTQAFFEASQPQFKEYTQQVIQMSQLMCKEFVSAGIDVITGGTDSHIILIGSGKKSGKEVANLLEVEYNIIVNKNSLPNDTRGVWETSGIRLGTAAMVTKRGNDIQYFRDIANKIINVIKN